MRARATGAYLVAAVLYGVVLSGALCAAALAGPREDAERATELLIQQARPLWSAGRYPQVLPLARRALAISEKALGPQHPLTVRSLNNVAQVCLKTGCYDEAEQLYRRVLALREQTLPPAHPEVAAALNNLAIMYGAVGDYARALPLQQRALAIREKVFGPDHTETAKSLNNLAILYGDTGDYARAEPLYQRALAIRERRAGPDHRDTADALLNLAVIYYFTGAYAQAEALNLRALSIYEKLLHPQHPDIASVLNNLGEVYVASGAHARAMTMYERALALREQALGPEHTDVGASLNNMAGLYRVLGEVQRAAPLYRRSLAIAEAKLGAQHPDTAKALNNLANLYLDTGELAKAEPLYARALAIRKQAFGAQHPQVAQSLSNLALLSWAHGRVPRALRLFQQAQAIQAKNSEQFVFSGSESRQRAYVQALADDTFVRVSFSVAAANRTAIELGLSSVLQYKGRVLETQADHVARLRRSLSTADHALLDRLSHLAAQASTELYRARSQSAAGHGNRRLRELTRQQDALEAQLAKRSSEFRQQTRRTSIASIRQAIPADAVLVEWIRYKPFDPRATSVKSQWGAPRYAAYVLTRRAAPAMIDLGDATALDQLAHAFNRAVSDTRHNDVQQRAAALSEKLIGPLLPHLQDHSRWLLAPDAALNLVPMAALLDAEGHYLAERFEISYLSSGRDLPRIAAAAASSRAPAVVVADPDYGSSPLPARINASRQAAAMPDAGTGGLAFKPLPGTAWEARSLQDLLKPGATELLLGHDASEAQLRRLHGPRLLHIATHGFFLGDDAPATSARASVLPTPDRNPLLRAGLALAGANLRRSGAHDDGILTALEMARLDLRGTQLVVLSACETALGEAASGDGIHGMRRALTLAGAQSQITSLWQISDQATRRLMVDFYRRLLQGAGRAAALRAAQRAMMADPARRHPYHWAGFVQVGNWQPIEPRP